MVIWNVSFADNPDKARGQVFLAVLLHASEDIVNEPRKHGNTVAKIDIDNFLVVLMGFFKVSVKIGVTFLKHEGETITVALRKTTCQTNVGRDKAGTIETPERVTHYETLRKRFEVLTQEWWLEESDESACARPDAILKDAEDTTKRRGICLADDFLSREELVRSQQVRNIDN